MHYYDRVIFIQFNKFIVVMRICDDFPQCIHRVIHSMCGKEHTTNSVNDLAEVMKKFHSNTNMRLFCHIPIFRQFFDIMQPQPANEIFKIPAGNPKHLPTDPRPKGLCRDTWQGLIRNRP